ncbi:MAG TPA: acyl-CoA dehydrogenase family protein [Acidimicrobiales bacterium]|nr:acyl-CoA dehydrogenase family protein [Acidimicrobiales bacterium]
MSTDIHDLDAYRDQVRAWLAGNLPERRGAALRTAHEISPDQLEVDRALQARVYSAGYLGITLPTEYGGQGLTSGHQRIWNEESARFAVPMPGGIASAVTFGIVIPTLLAHAGEEQKRAWIPKILSGEEIWCQLLSEPGAGSDLAGILTRATRDGDVWVINGTKVWSSGALAADFGICLARTDWDAPKHRGLTWFKVPLRDPAVTVRPVREINGSAEFCEEFLDDVAVRDEMVIGGVNDGWPIANTMLTAERSGGAGSAGGAAALMPPARKGLAPDLVKLATDRGLENDAATRQLIARGHISDWLQGQLVRRVGAAMLAGKVNPTAVSLIKLRTGIADPARAAIAMEIAGRAGIAWPSDDQAASEPAVNFLNGRIYSIAGGSNEIQRNIIGERLLGLPRETSVDSDKPFRDVLRDAKSWGTKPSR